MSSVIELRLARLIMRGGPFTADEVTAEGTIAIDSRHRPNGRQNGIGSFFRTASQRGLICWTGEVVQSKAPHRKGGAIRVWIGTDHGRHWAKKEIEANA